MSKTLLTATLFGLLTICAASAQNLSTLQANIPFDFTVGHQAMNAGDYRIVFNNTNHLLTVQGRGAHSRTAFVVAIPGDRAAQKPTGALLFDCYGGACSLGKVLPANNAGPNLQVTQPARRAFVAMQTRVVPLLLAEK